MALDTTAILNATCRYAALESAGTERSTTRIAITWAASGSNDVVTATEAFTGPAGQAVDTVGFYSALTGGSKFGTVPITGDPAFNAEGKYNITSLTISH